MPEFNIDASFLETLTLDDVVVIEDALDVPIDELLSGEVPVKKAKLMRAVAYIVARRADPEVTLEAIGQMSVGQVNELLNGVTSPRPT